MGKTITVDVAAAKLRVTPQRIRVLCRDRRIVGARLVGRTWVLPDDLEITPPRRGPQPNYRDRETAKDPITLRMGECVPRLFLTDDCKHLVLKVTRGRLTKTYVGRLISVLQNLHDQMT